MAYLVSHKELFSIYLAEDCVLCERPSILLDKQEMNFGTKKTRQVKTKVIFLVKMFHFNSF